MNSHRHTKTKARGRAIRHRRVRARVVGDQARPRLAVFRSSKHIYAQLIDDGSGQTLASASDLKLSLAAKEGKVKRAAAVGEAIAKSAMAKKIKEARFDRGGYLYTGRVKVLAEAARLAGLKF